MQEIYINIPPVDRRGSEAYKTLRTNLQFCGNTVKNVVITSCMPGEGKSTTSLNLAKSLADGGKRVLFIDADLRKSVLVSRCRVSHTIKGLSHYLSGQAMNRCKELGIEKVYQGVDNKLEKLLTITENLSEVAYIGDDINDFSCMISVKESGGVVGCPKDAAKKIIKLADYVAEHNGGEGAVRDFIEWIFKNEELDE